VTFANREQAGMQLGESLAQRGIEAPVVIGMARGGVPVAARVAQALHAPLDVAIVRKIGAPHQSEAAIGAIAEGGARVIDERAVRSLGVTDEAVEAIVERESAELARRRSAYRGGQPPLDVRDRNVVLVDDGLATGMSAIAAARSLRARGAGRIVLAVPVCAPQSIEDLSDETDEMVCLHSPRSMYAVSMYYDDFGQVTDDEVVAALQRANL
jgi:predicted phosphoribosyltransferase